MVRQVPTFKCLCSGDAAIAGSDIPARSCKALQQHSDEELTQLMHMPCRRSTICLSLCPTCLVASCLCWLSWSVLSCQGEHFCNILITI